MISTSLKTSAEAALGTSLWPADAPAGLQVYGTVWNNLHFFQEGVNSLIIAAGTVFLTWLLYGLAGYGLGVLQFPGRNLPQRGPLITVGAAGTVGAIHHNETLTVLREDLDQIVHFGLVAVFAPVGLGVREAILVALLRSKIGTADALMIAVAFRGLLTIVDVGAAAAGAIVLRLGNPPRRPEPAPVLRRGTVD